MKLLTHSLAALLMIFVVSARLDAAEWKLTEEHWFEMLIADAKAGWMNERVYDDGTQFRSVTRSELRIDRGMATIEVIADVEFIETHHGRPVKCVSIQKMSAQAVKQTWTFHDDHVEQVTEAGGRTTKKQLPMPKGDWLTPMAADRYAQEQRKSNVETYGLRVFQPDNGLEPVQVDSTRDGAKDYQANGRTVPVTVWKTITDVMPVVATEYYTADGDLLYQEVSLGFGTMVMRVTTEAKARAAGGGPPPELLVNTFVRPSRRLKNVMNLRRAELRMKVQEGAMPEIPSAASQVAEVSADGQTVILRINIDEGLAASAEDLADPALLDSSTMVNTDDMLVQKIARGAVRKAGDDPMDRAEALRARVNRHISRKGMQTAFASAAETAKLRQGDCSEHAVLLCAMLRAEKIPARVACGLVYVDAFAGEHDVFGWHMWTQAIIDGKWVDLDATLPRRYHAGHVLTATTTLADGSGMTELSSVMLLMGNLEIEIIDTGYGAPQTQPSSRPATDS